MDNSDLESMSFDELWELYEKVVAKLAHEVAVEKAKLEQLLRKIESASKVTTLDSWRRPYPKILPKSRNPKDPAGMH